MGYKQSQAKASQTSHRGGGVSRSSSPSPRKSKGSSPKAVVKGTTVSYDGGKTFSNPPASSNPNISYDTKTGIITVKKDTEYEKAGTYTKAADVYTGQNNTSKVEPTTVIASQQNIGKNKSNTFIKTDSQGVETVEPNEKIEKIYEQQRETQRENAAQQQYFWDQRAGNVGIAQSLLQPKTEQAYKGDDTRNIETFLTERGYDI